MAKIKLEINIDNVEEEKAKEYTNLIIAFIKNRSTGAQAIKAALSLAEDRNNDCLVCEATTSVEKVNVYGLGLESPGGILQEFRSVIKINIFKNKKGV